MSYRRYYSRDPYWLNAKFASVCACGKAIKNGDRIFYYPSCRKAVCEVCGRKGQAEIDDDDLNQIIHCM